jgi:hypothetical protein
MTTQTVERQDLHQAIDALPDDQLVMALDLLKDLSHEGLEKNDDGFYDQANVRWLKNSIAQMAQGKTVTKTFKELERMVDE